MFDSSVYVARRARLKEQVESGVVLFLGNQESPMNYTDNTYPFRQDSSFLYFFGLDEPGLSAMIDIDDGTECIFGDDVTIEDIIWMGPQPLLKDKASRVGVSTTYPTSKLELMLKDVLKQGRKIHFLPQYRPENVLQLQNLLGIEADAVQSRASVGLIKAVVEQRSIKSAGEIAEIESAIAISRKMQLTAMQMARPGVYEREVAGAMEGVAVSAGVRLAFPTIFSVHGETLHNHYHGNLMRDGDIAVNDLGAESVLHYSGDITRTIPVSGSFSQKQREVYEIVLAATDACIDAVKPGVEFRDVHRLAGSSLLLGLKDLGLVKGDVEEAVEAGVHALFFQCGVGHMLGLDTHDMEPLGEDYVGYTDTIKRNPEFGWRSLRLAKALEPGFVITVEPGLYFIPELIDRWKAEDKCSQYMNYDKLEAYRDFGGIRIEDDVLVTDDGRRILGPPIPRTIEEVEQACSQ
jgi:Xaa-Pro aminopeptidase